MISDKERVLAIDVGAGTQDILIYDPERRPENNYKLVLPSQTVVTGRRIAQATAEGRDVYLTGSLMGGGAISRAAKAHLQAGYRVYAEPQAAKTLHDNLERVRAMGVEIVDTLVKPSVVTVHTGDVDLVALEETLSSFGIGLPSRRAVAVQDHGEAPAGYSQRKFRFEMWERFLARGGYLRDLLYETPPTSLTRMRAVQSDMPGTLLMDTAGSAIWGALQDPTVAAQRERGLVVVNVGNGHIVAALVREDRIWGLFEHHTGPKSTAELGQYVSALQAGTLTSKEVYNDGGHGCAYQADYEPNSGHSFVAVTGPNWHAADDLGYYRAAPHGDMMIAGCYGLVAAAQERWNGES